MLSRLPLFRVAVLMCSIVPVVVVVRRVAAQVDAADEPIARASAEPLDSDGDGLFDHHEDADADGAVGATETDPHHPDTDRDGVHDADDLSPTHLAIPEPMVFDLVRGLDSHAGEVEINALVLSGAPGHAGNLRYAPEIEVAFASGFGLELELPVEGDTVEGVKGAIQGRISRTDDALWMHGFQVIGEYRFAHDVTDAHVLWLVTGLITPDLAMVAMLGGRITFHGDDDVRGRAIVNLSGYHAIGRDVWLGAELNGAWDPLAGDLAVRAVPQVHVSLHRVFRVQLGLGVEHEGTTHPIGGGRFIIEM
ncbi:MAG: hypothetical protein M3Y87_02585 [Myxococcota bacterium]|nr:hypothetical protein [Myxococcota bacterium]